MIQDAQDHMMGGIISLPAGGPPSHWMSYVTVDDIEAAVARVTAERGRVLNRHTAPGVGSTAYVMDRQGGVLALIQLQRPEGTYPREKAQNHITWSELHTSDTKDAAAFYTAVLGWKQEAWGDYITVGDEHAGGITKGQPGHPPYWMIYVNVADTDDTVRRAQELGAKVFLPGMDTPQGRMAIVQDPTGGTFSLMQSAKR
jgi:predicted enzyme related to lactoylglutathione lyase